MEVEIRRVAPSDDPWMRIGSDWLIHPDGRILICREWVRENLIIPNGCETLWIILSKTRIDDSWRVRALDVPNPNASPRADEEERYIRIEGSSDPIEVYPNFWDVLRALNQDRPVFVSFEYEIGGE